MKRITSEQREAIVRRAVAERDDLATRAPHIDVEAHAEYLAITLYESLLSPSATPWASLEPCEWDRWRKAANAVVRASRGRATPAPVAAPAPVPPLQGAETFVEWQWRFANEHGRRPDVEEAWNAAPLHAVGGQSPTVEQAITTLVSALADSKGWMRDYADAIVRDAIDRRGGEGEKAKRRCILGCEFLRGENICRSCGNAAKGDGS